MGLKITKHTKGTKMEGFMSLNTSVKDNDFCMKMREEDTICSKCYAYTLLQMYRNMQENVKINHDLLTERVIPFAELPKINALYFRFHSTGELVNEIHLRNFYNIAKKNPLTTFTLWTKRVNIVNKFKTKPPNLILVYSSTKVNQQSKLPVNFDKVFTVYTKSYAERNNVSINCGKRQCKDCLLCYTDNDVTVINEIKK